MLLEILNPAGTIQGLYDKMMLTTDTVLFYSLRAHLADLPATGEAPKVLLIPQIANRTDEPVEYLEAYENEANEDLRAEEESDYYYG